MLFPSKRFFRLISGTKRIKYFILNSRRNGKLLKQFTTDVDEKMQYNSESSTPKRLKTTLSRYMSLI